MSALSDRIDALVAALASNAALTAWCQTQYGKDHKVFSYMIDLDNPPSATDCPCIQFGLASALCGNGRTEHERQFVIVCRLFDDRTRTLTNANIVELTGGKNLCDFLQLTIAALAAVEIGNDSLNNIDAGFDDLRSFPHFMAGFTITFIESLCIGESRLSL